MSAGADLRLIVLWDDEIRTAAKALDRFFGMSRDTPESELQAAMGDALMASRVALVGAEEDGKSLVLSSREFFPRIAKKKGRPK